MPTYTQAFAGGVLPIPSYGQKDKFRFFGTWAVGDTWSVPVTTTLQGDFTIGLGNISNKNPTCGFKLRNRIYLGIGSQFALSANEDVTLWEEQNPGAAVVPYLSQYGVQDSVTVFSQLTGRLAVFGRQSIQLWKVDADPANLALEQSIDNTGTRAPLSVKAIGDLDVLYLHDSGIRSLRANQMYQNATTNDIGTAIDALIRAAQVSYDSSVACAIVDPTTKQYWLHLNGTIYVLSNYPTSKIVAWSTYKPTKQTTISTSAPGEYTVVPGSVYYWVKNVAGTSLTAGATVLTATGSLVIPVGITTAFEVGTAGVLIRVDTPFVPEKFVVYNGLIYVRSTDGTIYVYGNTDNNTYDRTRATVELPWLSLDKPSMTKQALGVDAAISGAWTLYYGLDPHGTLSEVAFERGSEVSPSSVVDSTFDIGHFPAHGNGTHVKLKMVSSIAATAAKLSQLVFLYSKGNVK